MVSMVSSIVDVMFPDGQQEGTRSVVSTWQKKVGELVKQHEPLLEISTDKVIIEVAAPATGVLKEILVAENAECATGQVLARIDTAAQTAATAQSSNQSTKQTSTTNPSAQKTADSGTTDSESLSPAVKKLIKEHNVDPARITGTGRGGRITHDDVMAYLASAPTSAAASNKPATATSTDSLVGRRVPHSSMRRSIAAHMVESMLRTAPHVTAIFEVNMAPVIAHREKHKEAFEKKGARLTFTAYFVQATVAAIRAVPEVNSRWHDDSLEIFDECNIGVATAIEGGLIVPVLRHAEKLDLEGTARALGDLTERARSNSLKPNEVQGGTFTITNHGVSGSLIATPIINQPQSAILGLGKLEKRPVVVEQNGRDEIIIEPRIYLTLTIDHRGLDGFQANKFLSSFVRTLEEY